MTPAEVTRESGETPARLLQEEDREQSSEVHARHRGRIKVRCMGSRSICAGQHMDSFCIWTPFASCSPLCHLQEIIKWPPLWLSY